MEPEFTLNGGILCFVAVREVLKREPKKEVNVLEEDLPQFGGALGAALLGKQRLKNLAQEGDRVDRGEENVSIPL